MGRKNRNPLYRPVFRGGGRAGEVSGSGCESPGPLPTPDER